MQDHRDVLAMVQEATARPGYTSSIGTEVVHAEPGSVHLALDRRPDLVQFAGHFHGGVIAGLADHAAGGAVTTRLAPGRFVVTINLTTSYVAPAAGDRLIARATATRVGTSIAHAAVELVVREGESDEWVCAHSLATFRVIDHRPRPAQPTG